MPGSPPGIEAAPREPAVPLLAIVPAVPQNVPMLPTVPALPTVAPDCVPPPSGVEAAPELPAVPLLAIVPAVPQNVPMLPTVPALPTVAPDCVPPPSGVEAAPKVPAVPTVPQTVPAVPTVEPDCVPPPPRGVEAAPALPAEPTQKKHAAVPQTVPSDPAARRPRRRAAHRARVARGRRSGNRCCTLLHRHENPPNQGRTDIERRLKLIEPDLAQTMGVERLAIGIGETLGEIRVEPSQPAQREDDHPLLERHVGAAAGWRSGISSGAVPVSRGSFVSDTASSRSP